MPRYIDANKVLEIIDEWLETVGYPTISKGCSYYYELQGCIEDTPTEDVQKVVRCKDCKFYHTEVYGTSHDDWCAVFEHHVFGGDWFCADGFRKEEKTNAEQ